MDLTISKGRSGDGVDLGKLVRRINTAISDYEFRKHEENSLFELYEREKFFEFGETQRPQDVDELAALRRVRRLVNAEVSKI